jgi:hypothetical protein
MNSETSTEEEVLECRMLLLEKEKEEKDAKIKALTR